MKNNLIKSRKKEGVAWILALWLMIAYHYGVITSFSDNSATISTQKRDIVVEKVVEVIDVVSDKEITSKTYDNVEFLVRKLAHFANFFILGFLCTLLSLKTNDSNYNRVIFVALICGLLGAMIDEAHQLFVAGRSGEIRDVCIDFMGVLFGCILFTVMRMICYVE